MRNSILSWWSQLDMKRGDRAALRRCRSPIEVAFQPSFYQLTRALESHGNPVDSTRMALIAGVLSHVRVNNTSLRFAQWMARGKAGKANAAVSGLRFRRYIRNEEPETLYLSTIREIRLLEGECNISDLANTLYWWQAPETKKRLASDYYENAPLEQ
ncbi:MAG: type I-E CRISPR-associated protein Cse2/CasB [Methanomicrobiales archaeon]|nr:type I-E CRISPR-associated protein Cse2/CasB [Methanomicrobiales archaeon]